MIKFIAILSLAIVSCSAVAGAPSPQDEQAQAWVPPPRECPTRTVVDCAGGTRTGALTIRESCTTVRNCTLDGRVSIRGDYSSASSVPPALSREPDYVARVRAQAPHDVWIEDSTVLGEPGKVAVYFGPGVTYSGLRRVEILPMDCSVPIYLGAETSRITVDDSTVDASDCTREAIAVDASDRFTIRRNRLIGGSVKAYRNCGERGVTRHTTPSYGRIIDNAFEGVVVAIQLSSRDLRNDWQLLYGGGFCLDDDGHGVGSSDSNYDFSRGNTVRGNAGGEVFEGPTAEGNTIQ